MDDTELLKKLREWRNSMAQREGVEHFRIMSNKTIDDIVFKKPKTKEDLLAIKGIKEKKFNKHGSELLLLINDLSIIKTAPKGEQENEKSEKIYSVSNYLDLLNYQFRSFNARVQGEVSNLDIRSNYLFFSIKDKKDESMLNCFMWSSDYELCGVKLLEGIETIVNGYPEIYKKSGRISLRASFIELVGEGVLKKAYDELKNRLEMEGLFALERKKAIPEFPQKIGLITSKTGAVIHDFLSNLGKYGYNITFVDSRVEGQSAVRDLISAVDYFFNKNIDVLVIIRGGGSLESLQAFNNEAFIRKIAGINMPVICGIGHEKDAPLASLVADLMVSTPTAVTSALNSSWNKALTEVQIFEKNIIKTYQNALGARKQDLKLWSRELKQRFDLIFEIFEIVHRKFSEKMLNMEFLLKDKKRFLNQAASSLSVGFQKRIKFFVDYLQNIETQLKALSPIRQLRLGYSIASIKGKIIKTIKQVSKGDKLDILVSDGKINSQIYNIIKDE